MLYCSCGCLGSVASEVASTVLHSRAGCFWSLLLATVIVPRWSGVCGEPGPPACGMTCTGTSRPPTMKLPVGDCAAAAPPAAGCCWPAIAGWPVASRAGTCWGVACRAAAAGWLMAATGCWVAPRWLAACCTFPRTGECWCAASVPGTGPACGSLATGGGMAPAATCGCGGGAHCRDSARRRHQGRASEMNSNGEHLTCMHAEAVARRDGTDLAGERPLAVRAELDPAEIHNRTCSAMNKYDFRARWTLSVATFPACRCSSGWQPPAANRIVDNMELLLMP